MNVHFLNVVTAQSITAKVMLLLEVKLFSVEESILEKQADRLVIARHDTGFCNMIPFLIYGLVIAAC